MKYLPSVLAYFLHERQARRNIKALLTYVGFLTLVIVIYSVLFHVIMWRVEGREYSWVTGIYWTLTVMSTLGFGDITFESDVGRAFSTFVLITGILLLLVLLPFLFIRFFYAPWLEARLRQRAPTSVPPETAGHVIVARYDAIAPGLFEKLRLHGIAHYVIEPDASAAARYYEDGVRVVRGEIDDRATYERLRAGQARLVVANLDDATNTNIVLTVREVAERTPIVAFATEPDAVDILELSGATHVLALSQQLGQQLANRVNAGHARSHVIGRYGDLSFAEFPVHNTPLVGRTLRESRLREVTGVSVIGVWERGRLQSPRPDTLLTDMSVPVVVGTPEQLDELDAFLVIYEANFNPVIVLGGGRVGRAAAQALRRNEIAVHVVEKNPALLPKIGEIPDRVILGDAADREVLRDAGLDAAPSVLITTHDDAMNIYLAAYCRRINPGIRIVSRVTHERNVEAVTRAGADLVLSYASLGAESILALLRGREVMLLGEGIDLFRLPVPAALVGRSLAESEIGARTGASVVAISNGGRLVPNPEPGTRLEPGGELLVVASAEQREQLLARLA